MSKTNLGLVEWAKRAHSRGDGYVWGTYCQKLTPALLQQKINQYPSGVGNHRTFIQNNYMGKYVADCVGLIKGYYWERNGVIRYNASTDVNANMMYSKATKKGNINTIPEIKGLCVWRKGHIGVYIGDGWVIEAQSTRLGVRKHRLRDRNFTHWLECPYIKYVSSTPIKPKPKPAPAPVATLETNIISIKMNNRNINLRGIHERIGGALTQYIAIRDMECLGFKVEWEDGITSLTKTNNYRNPNLIIDYIIDDRDITDVKVSFEGEIISLKGYTIKNKYDEGKMQFIKIRDLSEFGYTVGWDNNNKQVLIKDK